MSYILDALKRSEQQRQRGAAPSLLAAPAIAAAPRRPTALLYGLGAAALLLLVAGITIGMLRPWGAAAPALQPVAAKPPAATAPPALPVPAPAPAPATVEITIKTERQAPVPAPVPAPQAALPPVADAPKAQGPAPTAAAMTPAAKPAIAAEGKAPSPAAERPAGARSAEVPVLPLAELPLPIQQEIPKLSVLFHIYSANPKDRMVGINDRALREGDSVEPGLVLEQITADGMILTYKGYRFLRGSR